MGAKYLVLDRRRCQAMDDEQATSLLAPACVDTGLVFTGVCLGAVTFKHR